MTAWKLEKAKASFSELVRSARNDGPQEITVRGEPAAVLLSMEDYERLVPKQTGSWVDRIIEAAGGVEIDIQRSKDTGRDVDL